MRSAAGADTSDGAELMEQLSLSIRQRAGVISIYRRISHHIYHGCRLLYYCRSSLTVILQSALRSERSSTDGTCMRSWNRNSVTSCQPCQLSLSDNPPAPRGPASHPKENSPVPCRVTHRSREDTHKKSPHRTRMPDRSQVPHLAPQRSLHQPQLRRRDPYVSCPKERSRLMPPSHCENPDDHRF